MKRLLILILCSLMVAATYSKASSNKLGNTPDTTISGRDSSKVLIPVVYKLFPTQNMWTFIKLNTRNGKMWQVQFDVETDNRFEVYLNFVPLVSKNLEVDGRFTLYPTQNIYTFILLDQLEGKIWQVQWSMEAKNRFIIPIE